MATRAPSPFIRVVAVVALIAVTQIPQGVGARPGEEQSTEDERDEVRDRLGDVEIEIDDLETELDDLTDALELLAIDVADHEDELDEAERALTDAEDDLDLARLAVTDTENRIDDLEELTDDFMVAAFVNPPSESNITAFSSEDMAAASIKRVLLDLTSDTNADVFDELAGAREDLQDDRDTYEDLADGAETARDDVAFALADLEIVRGEQQGLADQAELALESRLAEAAVLEERDTALSEQIATEEAIRLANFLDTLHQAELARQQAEAEPEPAPAPAPEPAPSPGEDANPSPDPEPAPAPAPEPAPSPPAATISPAPGGLATVSCPGGGAITVAGQIASNLSGLLDAAAASGLHLCGWGYRDPQRQIELRQQNCGTSSYAVYQAPSSSCSPPTARPGASMHEQGLAVDFENCSVRSTACYQWLAANAASHGLYNLPSEPWHWSINGR